MKKLITIILLVLLMPLFVNAETKYLYDVLKEEAESGGLAKKYTGQHQDSFIKDSTHNIYHWQAPSFDDMIKVMDKNNIIFGNFCWKIMRTTDTGGTKLVYNGFPRNNNCKEYYGKSDLEIGFLVQTSIYDNFYYSTDFDIDEDKHIIPKGVIKRGNELSSTIGWFMFQTTDLNNKVYSAYYMIDKNLGIAFYSNWGQNNTIGSSDYNQFLPIKASQVGFMNNDKYEINSFKYENKKNHYYYMKKTEADEYMETPKLRYDNFFSDSGAKSINSTNENSILGKYIINDMYNIYYVVDILEDSYKTIVFNYSDGIPDLNDYYTFGDNYIKNSDGTYSLQNTTNIELNKFDSKYNDMNNKYSCLSYKDTCEKIVFITSATEDNYSFIDGSYNFSNDVEYENGYHQTGNVLDSKKVKNSIELLSKNHYFTFSKNNNKKEIQFFYYYNKSDGMIYYITLQDGEKVEDAINNITNNNSKDSYTKKIIDLWYNHYLNGYSNYIEDSIYCNNREVENIGGFSKSGDLNKKLLFKEQESLKCQNINNSFSINNSKANLKYPVGLMNKAEFKLMGYTDYSYLYTLLMDPSGITNHTYISSANVYKSTYLNAGEIKPVITLEKDSVISGGTGSQEDPYIFGGIERRYKINVKIVDQTKDLNINIEDLTQVEHDKNVNFKVTPIKGYKIRSIKIIDEDNNEIKYTNTNKDNYMFKMPSSDITIIPTYEKVRNSVTVENNKNTKKIVIEVNDTKAVVYEDTVRFKITPKEGYKLENIKIIDAEGNKINYKKTNQKNEYEFIMPDTDVVITPIYRKIESSNANNTKKNPNTGTSVILIVLISIFILSITRYILNRNRDGIQLLH